MGGLLSLVRPLNCAMAAGGVAIGGIVAVGPQAWGASAVRLVVAALAAASFTAGGNALNDYYDRETDRVNHPERPIPSGRLRAEDALRFAAASFVLAGILAALVTWECVAMVAMNAAVMLAYEARLKARGAPGNVVIAYLVGSLFLFSALAVYEGRGEPLLLAGVLGALAGLTTLGREITKDIEDLAGDVDRRTLPKRIGARGAGIVAASALLGGVVLSVLPWRLGLLDVAYAGLVLVADGMFIYAALYSAARPAGSQRIAKVGMIVALVAFLAGGIL